jgi:hypothetical protein
VRPVSAIMKNIKFRFVLSAIQNYLPDQEQSQVTKADR